MRRVTELDGLRGVAVLLVIFAHMQVGVLGGAPGIWPHLRSGGGVVGVQLFFVLSGYLITSLLLAEREATGRIRLGGFYARRARRLLPALFVLVAVHLLIAAAVGDIGLGLVDAATVLGYVAHIFPAGLLSHAWSLSVEEQFYVAWPALVLVGYALRGRTGIVAIASAGIATTVGWRFVIGGDVAYHLLRWDALLVGCVLAVVGLRRPPRWATVAAVAVIVGYTVHLPGLGQTEYVATTVACAVVLCAARDARWLRHPLLVRAGLLSYALYLWHVWLLRLDMHPLVMLPVAWLIAEASFRFVETRWRHTASDTDAERPASVPGIILRVA